MTREQWRERCIKDVRKLKAEYTRLSGRNGDELLSNDRYMGHRSSHNFELLRFWNRTEKYRTEEEYQDLLVKCRWELNNELSDLGFTQYKSMSEVSAEGVFSDIVGSSPQFQ